MKIDVLVPVYKLDKYRQKSLDLLRKHVAQEEGVNLVVIEQDVAIWPEFNKGWLLNMGARKSNADWLAVVDVDVVPKYAGYFQEAVQWATERKLTWCFGWDRLIYEGKTLDKPAERDDWPSPGIQEGGIVMFSAALWNMMGGANEHIRELRGCDNDLALRAMYVSKTRSCHNTTLCHRWHPKSPMKKTKWRKNNNGILEYTLKHPAEVVQLLKKQPWGDPGGPYCRNQSFYEMRGGK